MASIIIACLACVLAIAAIIESRLARRDFRKLAELVERHGLISLSEADEKSTYTDRSCSPISVATPSVKYPGHTDQRPTAELVQDPSWTGRSYAAAVHACRAAAMTKDPS